MLKKNVSAQRRALFNIQLLNYNKEYATFTHPSDSGVEEYFAVTTVVAALQYLMMA